jgi:hypothetical protein
MTMPDLDKVSEVGKVNVTKAKKEEYKYSPQDRALTIALVRNKVTGKTKKQSKTVQRVHRTRLVPYIEVARQTE